MSLIAACTFSVVVTLGSFLLAQAYCAGAVRSRESLIDNDLVTSIDRMLTGVRSRYRAPLVALVGRPCDTEVRAALSEGQTHVRYVRAVILVSNGHGYCSSALGPIDLRLSDYVDPAGNSPRLKLLEQTPYQANAPVVAMFDATHERTGILYLIEGAYIADVLAHGSRFGGRWAALSVDRDSLLLDDGTFVQPVMPAYGNAARVSSSAWSFSVSVSASPVFVSNVRWKYGLIFGTLGLLLNVLVAAAYLLTVAPRRLLLRAIRRGLRNGEFHVVYQPIVAIVDGRVAGVEALLRWTHPKWGAVSPSVFMGEVESSPLLAEVTRFVMRTSLAEMSPFAATRPLRIGVNVAPGDLERKNFAADVLALIQDLPSEATLVLELTERFLLNRSTRTDEVFRTLKAAGIQFAIDDFGTDNSNLDLLGRFPFDFVKIDGQYTKDIDRTGPGLVQGIAYLTNHFGLRIIAEGVETEVQHSVLRDIGVPFGQGYYYQSPQRAECFAEVFARVERKCPAH